MDKARTGNLIKEARISKNLTQSELGAVLGVSNKAVSRWENGDSFPDVGILENLAETLGLTIEDIVSGGNAGENSDTISEVIHIVKIQKVEKSQRNRRVAGCVLELCVCLVAGCRGLTGKSVTANPSVSYGLLMAISLGLLLVFSVRDRKSQYEVIKTGRCLSLLSFILYMLVLIFSWAVSLLIINDIFLWGLNPEQIGTIIDGFFRSVFVVDFLLVALNLYRFNREKSGIGVGDLLAVGAAYSIMINCSLFYNIESRVHVLPALTTCTLVIVGVTVAAAGILCLCHKTRQRSLNN